MTDYKKDRIIYNIERNTKNILYYMAQAAKAMQNGESPVGWLARAIEYGANLNVDYSKADDLETYDDLDFKQLYANALKHARDIDNNE